MGKPNYESKVQGYQHVRHCFCEQTKDYEPSPILTLNSKNHGTLGSKELSHTLSSINHGKSHLVCPFLKPLTLTSLLEMTIKWS